ncbi:hypothetical protein [Rhizobium sp. TRM95796]|uniref:hypothetical protein n=1 Tax=Rhizobium sp. TRM95796 TaxID=2979862 RepID=UPI0021E72E13|nr:hypothetical protein [Rhizobium sp. TRM95796]MCV3763998.1 hypothetical protein [Rhizobium sp. TRM95796]
MSSITEARLASAVGYAAGVAAIGLAALAIQPLTLVAVASPQTVRVLTGGLQPNELPEGVEMLDWSGGQARLEGVDARAARQLYRRGALLILPERPGGCIALSS